MNRAEIADWIASHLRERASELTQQFHQPGRIQSFTLDDLLPETLAHAIFREFPTPAGMVKRKTLREHKFIAAQMNHFSPLLEEALFAFQARQVVDAIADLTGFEGLSPDENLYAGGLSLMAKGCFLSPHIDNSHDKDQRHYRVLNLLYYVTPDWDEADGGNLELWDEGVKKPCRVVPSRFNRLVVMATHPTSWHSVDRVKVDRARCCISNYYFAATPPTKQAYAHVTTFRGRPEEPWRDWALQGDNWLRGAFRRVVRKGAGILESDHVYKR